MGLRGHTAEAVLLNHTGFVELSVMCVREREIVGVKAESTVGMSVPYALPLPSLSHMAVMKLSWPPACEHG